MKDQIIFSADESLLCNQYKPWEQEGITELAYFKKRMLERGAENAELEEQCRNLIERNNALQEELNSSIEIGQNIASAHLDCMARIAELKKQIAMMEDARRPQG